jgi:hypothetical protein
VSKAYKGKTCTYCAVVGISTTADHVVAREFFPLDQRQNLPKVPSCQSCNVRKSVLEHYLATVLPFANRNPDSSALLVEKVPSRLAKNVRLHRELASGAQALRSLDQHGVLQSEMTLPFEGERIEALFRMIAQGLCMHHWDLLLPPSQCEIQGGYLHPEGEKIVERLLAKHAARRVSVRLGSGIFEYEGVQATDRAEITVWRMSLYNAVVSDGTSASGIRTSNGYVATGLKGKVLPLNS